MDLVFGNQLEYCVCSETFVNVVSFASSLAHMHEVITLIAPQRPTEGQTICSTKQE